MGNELDSAVQDYVEAYEKSWRRTDEDWKRDHEEVKLLWLLEDTIELGNSVFRRLEHRVAAWRRAVASGVVSFDDKDNQGFLGAFRTMLDPEEIARRCIAALQQRGFSARGADELLQHFERTRKVLQEWVPPVLSKARGQHVCDLSPDEAARLDQIIASGEALIRTLSC
jgi:hypothetical protein